MQDLYNATAALHLSISELIEAIRTDPVLSNAEIRGSSNNKSQHQRTGEKVTRPQHGRSHTKGGLNK